MDAIVNVRKEDTAKIFFMQKNYKLINGFGTGR